MDQDRSTLLAGRRIGVTAERRADQQLRYLEKRGASTVWAPVMRTRAAGEFGSLRSATSTLLERFPDLVVFNTGQGLKWWLDALDESLRSEVIDMLSSVEVWTRGSKATSSCRKIGVEPAWQAPTETLVEVVQRLEATDLSNKRVAIQDNGTIEGTIEGTGGEVLNGVDALASAERGGADVVSLDVYRYAMPEDRSDVVQLIDGIIVGTFDAVTFTSSPAIRHLRAAAVEVGRCNELDAAFQASTTAVVVGPVCADTARDATWTVLIEPEQARLIPMLDALTSAFH